MKTRLLAFIAPLALGADAAWADGNSMHNIQSTISGVYTLAEWHIDGVAYTPPQVAGRFVLLDGTITTVLHNRSQTQKQTTSTMVGTYTLDSSVFTYGYEDVSTSAETPSGASVSHELPWKGRRAFTVSAENGVVHFRAVGGHQEFAFSAEGMTYTEDGTPLRTWRRVTSTSGRTR